MKKKKVTRAAALKYSSEKDNAPKVVASGRGEVAEKIFEKAIEENVPVYQDANLAETLTKIKLGSEIPEELYNVVAEVLAFISLMDESYRGGEKID